MIILEGLLGTAVTALILAGLVRLGRFAWTRAFSDAAASGLPMMPFAAGLGIALFSTATLGLGLVGWLHRPLLAALTAAVGALGLWEAGHQWRRAGRSIFRSRRFWFTAATLFVLVAPAIPFLLQPPLSRDALVYHLEVPRQYLLNHGVLELPRNVYAYFPKGMEMLFLAAMGLFPAWSTQFVHFSFLALTLLAVVEYAAAIDVRAPRWLWFPAILAFGSVPTLWLDATYAYIDTGLMLYTTLAAIGLDWHHRRGDPAPLAGALFLAGFTLAIKYTALYFVLALVGVALAMSLGRRSAAGHPLRPAAALVAGMLFFAGPYFAWNAWHTGNPVFPFLGSLFPLHNPLWTSAQADAFWGFLANYGRPFDFPLAPLFNYLVAAVNPVLHLPRFFDGVLGPFLLAGALAFLPHRRSSSADAFTGLTVVAFAVVWGVTMRQARFLLPALPLLLLLLIRATQGWWGERSGRRAAWMTVCTGILLFNLAVLVPELADQPGLPLLAGQLTREQVLESRLPVYACQRYINRELPADARIWTLQTGNEQFYLERDYEGDYVVEDFTFHSWLAGARQPAEIAGALAATGATHLLIRTDAVLDPSLYSDIPEQYPLLLHFFRRHTRLLYEANGFAVLELDPAARIGASPP
jgi:hypothetical protein